MELLTPVRHPRVRSAERLEAEISDLAGHLAAATCRFLSLIAEFDRLDGWVGHRSCAQWLSWRCGLSASTAREHVRVGHALEECPIIRETFAAGRLSYSKVRAITRVAHSGNEAELVQTALVTTAAQLDRIVQAMRTATRQQVRERHQLRTLSWRWDDDGMLVLSIRLDPDEGAVALAALRAAQSPEPHPASAAGASAEAPAVAGSTAAPAEARRITPSTGPSAEAGAIMGSAAASAEVPAGCPAGPEGPGITLVDAFSAVMTSYLGSAARDTADPEAFQVVVLTDAITPAKAGNTRKTVALSRPSLGGSRRRPPHVDRRERPTTFCRRSRPRTGARTTHRACHRRTRHQEPKGSPRTRSCRTGTALHSTWTTPSSPCSSPHSASHSAPADRPRRGNSRSPADDKD